MSDTSDFGFMVVSAFYNDSGDLDDSWAVFDSFGKADIEYDLSLIHI